MKTNTTYKVVATFEAKDGSGRRRYRTIARGLSVWDAIERKTDIRSPRPSLRRGRLLPGEGAGVSAHERLLDLIPGYAAFVKKEQEIDPDTGLVEGFADWLVGPEGVQKYVEWHAEEFRAEWEHWNFF